MAVKRQPGFEPQRIPRAKADGLTSGSAQSRSAISAAASAGSEISNAVLAGVARARDGDIVACKREPAEFHEGQRLHPRTWRARASAAFGPCKARSARSSR